MKNILMRCLTLILFLSLFSSLTADMGGFALVDGAKVVSLSEAEDMLKENNATIFDVNTQEVRDSLGYIPGAIFLDFNDEKSWDKLLPKDKNTNVIFYCLNRLCYEASQAALSTQEKGYVNSFAMMDGLEGWITSARPIDKKSIIDWKDAKNLTNFTDGVHHEIVFGELPACRDCHGTTSITGQSASKGIKSTTAADRMLINKNCVSCHDDIGDSFEGSTHKVNFAGLVNNVLLFNNKTESGKKTPLCADCHTIHTAGAKGLYSPKQISSFSCTECHEVKGKHYDATFHGKANKLNLPGVTPTVASCADCHGGHNVFKVDDFRSTLSAANRVETCSKCHPNSNSNFANYIAHADHTDSAKYPALYWTYVFMTGLLITVFVFFGIHTGLWAMRLLILKLRYPDAWKKAKKAAHEDNVTIVRFGLYHRIQHFFLAASFLGLSISGMPQKFYEAPWAQTLIDWMGGPMNAAKIHHISALIMGLVFAAHIAEIFIKAWINRNAIKTADGKYSFKLFLKALFGPDSLMPRLQDLRDLRDNFKWFLGLGERPQFDRWTYWEKFDYLAVFWGMFIIGFSGLVLLFPVFFTKVLPGQAINIAFIFHSDEALLAMGFIFAIHFFNTHFRPDRFPIDMVIFKGSISKEEMTKERAKWYDRLKASNKLDKMIEKDVDFSMQHIVAKIIGFTLMGIGLILLVLIIYAFIA